MAVARGAVAENSVFGAVFVHAGLEKNPPPVGPLWPGGAAPPSVSVAGAPRPWDVARNARPCSGARMVWGAHWSERPLAPETSYISPRLRDFTDMAETGPAQRWPQPQPEPPPPPFACS